MGVPKSFEKIVTEIIAWQEKNKDVVQSPYTSESFGGYSYTKASGNGSKSGAALTWRDIFKSSLNAYRKIA